MDGKFRVGGGDVGVGAGVDMNESNSERPVEKRRHM